MLKVCSPKTEKQQIKETKQNIFHEAVAKMYNILNHGTNQSNSKHEMKLYKQGSTFWVPHKLASVHIVSFSITG